MLPIALAHQIHINHSLEFFWRNAINCKYIGSCRMHPNRVFRSAQRSDLRLLWRSNSDTSAGAGRHVPDIAQNRFSPIRWISSWQVYTNTSQKQRLSSPFCKLQRRASRPMPLDAPMIVTTCWLIGFNFIVLYNCLGVSIFFHQLRRASSIGLCSKNLFSTGQKLEAFEETHP